MKGIVRRSGNCIEFIGDVNEKMATCLMIALHEALNENADKIILTICSGGGDGHIAFQLYARIWKMMRLNARRLGKMVPLWTCAVGDVLSAGIIVFMAGNRRYMTSGALLGLHEGIVSLSSKGRQVSLQAIRDSIEAISRNDHCLCGDPSVRILMGGLRAYQKRTKSRRRLYSRELGIISRTITRNRHCCDQSSTVLTFLQSIVDSGNRSDYVYAGIVARRSGLPIAKVLELMRHCIRLDGAQARTLGLAHECV